MARIKEHSESLYHILLRLSSIFKKYFLTWRRGHFVFLVQFCRAFYRGGSARKWCDFSCAGAFAYNGLENTSCMFMRWMYNYGNYAESKFLVPYGVEILIALCCYKIRPAPASGRPRAGRPPVADTSAAWAALAYTMYYCWL